MKIEQVLYLEDIAKTHSITQTAQRFFMSQQSLSFSISKLEEEFSCVLVERSNKGAKMGEELLREMSPYARRYETLKEKFAIHSERLDTLKRSLMQIARYSCFAIARYLFIILGSRPTPQRV